MEVKLSKAQRAYLEKKVEEGVYNDLEEGIRACIMLSFSLDNTG